MNNKSSTIGGTLPELEKSATSLKKSVEWFIALLDLRRRLSMLGGGAEVQRALVALAQKTNVQAQDLTRQAMEFHEGFFFGRLLDDAERVNEYHPGDSSAILATTTIPAGTLIQDSMIALIPYQREMESEDMIQHSTQVIGRCAKTEIPLGKILTLELLE